MIFGLTWNTNINDECTVESLQIKLLTELKDKKKTIRVTV